MLTHQLEAVQELSNYIVQMELVNLRLENRISELSGGPAYGPNGTQVYLSIESCMTEIRKLRKRHEELKNRLEHITQAEYTDEMKKEVAGILEYMGIKNEN